LKYGNISHGANYSALDPYAACAEQRGYSSSPSGYADNISRYATHYTPHDSHPNYSFPATLHTSLHQLRSLLGTIAGGLMQTESIGTSSLPISRGI
jgi:hypothetical protein